MTAVFVGEESLLVTCGDAWLNRGHRIEAILTDAPAIVRWAKDRELPVGHPKAALELLDAHPGFDFLFSVVNNTLLPDELLELPTRAAINFHDAPLPRYAGINASNWALINGEQEHGISWHLMTELIDGGDIIEQRRFPIRSDDTAITLNARCWEEALAAFIDMMDRLAAGPVEGTKQDLSRRTYVERWKRPTAAATIDWSDSSSAIGSLIRGLDHGTYFNPLGTPKVLIGDEPFIVDEADIVPDFPADRAGVITDVDAGSFAVLCATGKVVVRGLQTLDGVPVVPSEALARAGLAAGDKLPLPSAAAAATLTDDISRLARHEQYWIGRLADLHPVSVPYGENHPSEGDRLRHVADLPVGVTHATPHTLAAVFLMYLMRVQYTTTYDIAFRGAGQVISDVSRPYVASHVPLRVHLSDAATVGEFIETVEHDLERVASCETYARDLRVRTPDLPEGNEAPYFPVALELVDDEGDGAPAALTVRIPAAGDRTIWLHDPAVISSGDVERMQAQFNTLLRAAIDRPGAVPAALELVPEGDRIQLEQWNKTFRDYDLDTCLHYMFEAQVEQDPDAVAVTFGDTRLTYAELNERANQLGHHLRSRGVGPDVRVGVLAERSVEMVVALYGVLKAGGAYVPMDPDYPADRLSFMMDDADVPFLLTQEHLLGLVPANGPTVICLDRDWQAIAEEAAENPAHINEPSHLAYVIYTSGSTGRPKGAMNEHRGIVNRLIWMQEAFGLDGGDRVLQKTPFSFDVSVWEFFWPLQVGARLVVAEPGGHMDPAYLVRTIQQEAITTLHFVPSMLQLFVTAAGIEECSSLRRIICSGEALPRELQDRLFAQLDTELHNLYGPTEAAVDVSWWACDPASALNFIPIGRAIANTQLHVLDGELRPVPIGVAGELHIGGVQVARGYLNRPELTAEKFIDDPFRAGGRLYKTGDLARFLPDGNVEFLGRIDHQVKIRGLRIELGEIEAVLNTHPGVREAIVMAREDTPGDKRLVGYFVAEAATPGAAELARHLATDLPEYMIPGAFVELAAFPLTPNGKIDRKVLPPPRKPAPSATFAPPTSGVERQIAEIWSAILDVEDIGLRDTFFDLGGHSLLVMQLAQELTRAFDREVAVSAVFRYPTVEQQARFLADGDGPASPVEDESANQRQRKAAAARRRRRARLGEGDRR